MKYGRGVLKRTRLRQLRGGIISVYIDMEQGDKDRTLSLSDRVGEKLIEAYSISFCQNFNEKLQELLKRKKNYK